MPEMYVHGARRLVPLTLWRPPVTRRQDAFMAPWYGSPHATATCPVAYHNGSWTRDAVAGEGCQDTDESIYFGCTLLAERTWAWHVGEGNPDHPPDSVLTRDVWKASCPWIAFIGDSIARKVLISLLKVIEVDQEHLIFDRHADYEYKDDSVKATLHWAPFPQNATALLNRWARKETGIAPDVVVISVSLWHMLHIHNTSLFESSLADLHDAVIKHRHAHDGHTRYFFMSSPEVYNDHLKSLEKKKYMTYSNTDAYNRILVESGMFMEHGHGGPCTMLDVFRITHDCGAECSLDGIHSRDSVYNVLVLTMFNILKYCTR